MATQIAYLINHYPKISHSFVRREIAALERQGFKVSRISLTGWDDELVEPDDVKERAHTWYVLQAGMLALFGATLWTLLTAPVRFFSAIWLAVRVSQGAERSLPYHLVYLAEACRILPWLKSSGALHLHAHFGTNSAEVAMLQHALGGLPYSFTVHGQDELLSGGMEEKAGRAAFVVAISSFGRGQLYRHIRRVDWPKVNVVHCGLDNAFHAIAPVPPPASPRIVCVGRFGPEKAHLLLIEATNRLVKAGIGLELVLVGDGEMRAAIEEMIRRFDLGERVRITGWLRSDQVRDEILAARALVLPSLTEGLPVVIMEAMALRRPVIATYVGGIPELVVPGVNGWLLPASSVDDLEAAMRDCVLLALGQLHQMGEAAHLRAMERHSVDSEARKLAGLFQQAIAQVSPA